MKLYENTDLSQDFETDWIAIDYSKHKPSLKVRSLNVLWENVEGDLKGRLEIFASPDRIIKSVGVVLPISTNTNAQDTSIFLLVTSVRYVKFSYNSNGTTSGKIRIFLEIQ